jgi:hypothetical protein
VDFLQKTGRYGALLSQISNANDKSNFLALTLELNFAYQFESVGLELMYEVSQDAQQNSTIDFCVASSTSGQKAKAKMRDFDLLQSTCRGSEVYEQRRTSTIYGGAEIRDFTRGGSARG